MEQQLDHPHASPSLLHVSASDQEPGIYEPSDQLSGTGEAKKRVMVAYLYQRPGTPAATKELLRSYIEDFAQAHDYVLDSIFVGVQGNTERFTISDLLTHVIACHASLVVVAGPAYEALSRLRATPGLQVLTLADTQRRPPTDWDKA